MDHSTEATIRKNLSFIQNDDFSFFYTCPTKDLIKDWSKINLISNYIADYSSYIFTHKDKAENLISTVVNEILESLVRLMDINAELDIQLQKNSDVISFNLMAQFSDDGFIKYRNLIEEVTSSKLKDNYLNLLQEDWSIEDNPGFGFYLIAHDYNASIGYEIDTHTKVTTTQVQINSEEIEN